MLKEASLDTTFSFLMRVLWRLLPSILSGFVWESAVFSVISEGSYELLSD